MKHRVTLIFFVIISLIFISCPLQSPQAIPEGFYFDEAKFQEAKQKWQNATLENYEFKYEIWLGGYENPPFDYTVQGKTTVTGGVSYEDEFLLDMYKYEDGYSSGGVHLGTAFNKLLKEVEETYHVTSVSFMTIDDAYRFIEERVELAKNLYDNGKCSYYEAKIDYDDYYSDYGVIYKFSDSYIFKGKKKIDGETRVRFLIKWFTISNTP